MSEIKLIQGDSLQKLKELEENSVDSICCDPPYGLSFMGKKWDYDVPSVEIWEQCFRVLKPGGMLLAFAGTRTQHRMAVNIEDAGFEIRDMIAWVYGSGFPKSHNIGKAVDKLHGNDREIVGEYKEGDRKTASVLNDKQSGFSSGNITKGTSPYEGWGTALKPALEPITVARKPLSERTVANNVLKYGTGGINIDECRVGNDLMIGVSAKSAGEVMKTGLKANYKSPDTIGRFPANFIHDGSDEVVGLFPETKSGKLKKEQYEQPSGNNESMFAGDGKFSHKGYEADSGSASRFFYCAKASKKDRNEGLEEFEDVLGGSLEGGNDKRNGDKPQLKLTKNNHPTVKPTKLMQYLVRLVTPKGGTVLDPFMGSGSTGKACKLEGFDFIGIDLDPEYCKIAQARIDNVKL